MLISRYISPASRIVHWCSLVVFLTTISIGSSKIHVYDLPLNYKARVVSIFLDTRDAFEGSKVSSQIEEYLFQLGNSLHIKTHNKTIMKLILFSQGDTVTSTLLIETEKNLRGAYFLADAKIQVQKTNKGINVYITTYDHWSTTPGVGIKRLGGKWIYWVGLQESNLFGTGQTISLAYHKDLLRTFRHIEYKNPLITKQQLRCAIQYSDLSDGRSFKIDLNKPLRAKTDRLGFSLQLHSTRRSDWYFFDANQFETSDQQFVPRGAIIGEINPVVKYTDVDINMVYGALTQSFGFDTKLNISYYTFWYQRHQKGFTNIVEGFEEYIDPVLNSIPGIQDRLLGLNMTLYQSKYGTTRNLRNLKWTEDFDRGWLLSLRLGKNIKLLGADNNYPYISPRMSFTSYINEKHFINGNLLTSWFMTPSGKKERGQFDVNVEYQLKPIPIMAGFIAVQWRHLFGEHPTQQILLGDDTDLYGYPNKYFTGQARIKVHVETRLIPDIDFLTLAPAFVIYYVGGNVFPTYHDVDITQLHSSVGIGLRLGLTRSVNMVINHINLSWPLDENLPGPVLSIQSKTSL